MDILKKIGFFLLLFGIIGGEVLRIDNGQGVAMTFFDIASGAFVCVSLLGLIVEKKLVKINQVQKYLFWFVGIGLVSLLLRVTQLTFYQFVVSLLYAVRLLIDTVGIAWGVAALPANFRKKIPYFLLGVSVVLSLVGFLQYAYYPSLRNLFYAGWDPHLYRIFSTFLDPNFMGLLYVLGVIMGISIFFATFKKTTRLQKLLLEASICINIAALFMTYSRGAYLAFFAALVVLLWRGKYKKFILGAFLGIVVLVFLIELLSPKSEGTKLFRTASIHDRVVSLQTVTTIISHDPLLGVGLDAYRYAQQKEGFLISNTNTTHSGAGTDNSFLFAFATTGIGGFVAYLLMTYHMLKMSYTKKTLAGSTLFASLLALIVGSFFVNALFYPFLLAWVWMLSEV